MTVADLINRLSAYEPETEVLVQDPSEGIWQLHPCLGEACEGEYVVIMATAKEPVPDELRTPHPLPREEK